nr:MAG TPA: hypothetical protein [Caudoviricetes sp.]
MFEKIAFRKLGGGGTNPYYYKVEGGYYHLGVATPIIERKEVSAYNSIHGDKL